MTADTKWVFRTRTPYSVRQQANAQERSCQIREQVGILLRRTFHFIHGALKCISLRSLISLVAISTQALSTLLLLGGSITAIDHATAPISTTVNAAAQAVSAAIATAIETRKDACPAARDAAGEDVDTPGSRTIAAAIESRTHIVHVLGLSHPVVIGIRYWRVIHAAVCYTRTWLVKRSNLM